MKNSLVPHSQVVTAAVLPLAFLAFVLLLAAWFGWGWRSDANAARVTAAKYDADAAQTQNRVDILKGNKDRVDAAWKSLSAGAVKVGASVSTVNAGPSVNVADLPLNKGAAASGGFSGVARRELPEALSALAEADFFIQPQPAGTDRKFRHFGIASDKIEFGRLIPLVASIEARYPLALLEDCLLNLPPTDEVFAKDPRPLDARLAVRLPLYDPSARAADAKKKVAPGAKAATP